MTEARCHGPPSPNRLGSCNAACGRYRRRHQNGSLGRGAGHPSAELSLGSRGVMNRRTLSDRPVNLARPAVALVPRRRCAPNAQLVVVSGTCAGFEGVKRAS